MKGCVPFLRHHNGGRGPVEGAVKRECVHASPTKPNEVDPTSRDIPDSAVTRLRSPVRNYTYYDGKRQVIATSRSSLPRAEWGRSHRWWAHFRPYFPLPGLSAARTLAQLSA